MKTPQTTLATIGLILIFTVLWRAVAQERTSSEKVYSQPTVKTLESGETEIELQQVLPTPTAGTFYSLQLNLPPMPLAPAPEFELPIYFWGEGIFLFDDLEWDYPAMKAAGISLFNMGNPGANAMRDGPPVPGEGEGGGGDSPTNSFPPAFSYTNGELYLDIYSYDSNWMTLKIVNTIENNFYEILTKTNLSESTWAIDHGVIGFDGLTLANAISVAGKSNLFYWARNSGYDEDGDGLPDWWELENGLDPTLADTGNTGTPDGYKDVDEDGWTNLEEFQNGTSPGGFNTPPAPRGLTVSLNSGGTVANLSWNPSGGAVTGYTIERLIVPSDLESFAVSASISAFGDTSVPEDIIPSYDPPRYRIRATYASGNSAWSPYVSVHHRSTTGSWFWLVRGPGGLSYLVSSAISTDVTGIKVTRVDYTPAEPAIIEFTIPVTNFVDGVTLLTETQVPVGSGYIYWVQTIATDGTLGDFVLAGSAFEQSTLFFDGREQLKQNLSFLLRAANVVAPFDVFVSPDNGLRTTSDNYAYASFYNLLYFLNDSVSMTELRPFEDNYIYRNFAFDAAYLDSSGQLTNGIDYDTIYMNLAPYRFQTLSSTGAISAILSSNLTTRIFHPGSYEHIGIYIDQTNQTQTLSNDAKNIFGLDYLSVRTAYGSSNGVQFVDIDPGQTLLAGNHYYPNVAEPNLQTVDYYFGRPEVDPLPGDYFFAPTNTTPLFFVSGNDPFYDAVNFNFGQFRLAAYAKQSIDNGDTNKFAYLGLYFDKAYKVNTDGSISTNETGILSEYGEFFPTEPGRVWLTTKPESVGETNIGGVLVHTIKLELDVNHDGTIDRSITGPDNTSYLKPFVFWVNNDKDIVSTYGDVEAFDKPDSDDNEIKSVRDLEDFARLWISGVPSLPSSEGYAVTLSWQWGSGPTIRLFDSMETDGGIGYLTNGTTASNIVQSSTYRTGIGTVSSSSVFNFPANYFNGTRKHFIFEGVTPGEGELMLTITKSNQPIATTSVFITLKDIKDLYEQVLIDNVTPGLPPSTLISRYTGVKSPVTAATEAPQLVVFVHGINISETVWRIDSATTFKRLYWSGYQGRVASVKWPCAYLPPDDIINPADILKAWNYNKGEFYSWKSAGAFGAYLQNFSTTHTNYQINILAHSQGNVLASEAIKLGAPFDNYILSQAAVPAHAYDVNAPFLTRFTSKEASSPTPLIVSEGGYDGYFTNLTGRIINFYNTNDYALAKGFSGVFETNWEKNHESLKPVFFPGQRNYEFDITNRLCRVLANFEYSTVTDPHEQRSMVARTRSRAIGAQWPTGQTNQGVITATVDLGTQFGFDSTRKEHSAQFARSIQTVKGYYDQIIDSIDQP